MSGLAESSAARTVLVVGVHQRERDYGQNVARILSDSDIKMLCIDKGLPQKTEFDGNPLYYSAYLREIYLQLHQQIKKKFGLMIDLHTGINETERCADIFCSDTKLLDKIDKLLRKNTNNDFSDDGPIHLIKITEKTSRKKNIRRKKPQNIYPICHSGIPKCVWKTNKYLYIGLEIYLQNPGKGTEKDWRYGSWLINTILKAVNNTPS